MVTNRIEFETIEATEDEMPALRALIDLVGRATADELCLKKSGYAEVSVPGSAVKLLRLCLESLVNHERLRLHHPPLQLSMADVAGFLDLPIEYIFEMASRRGMLIVDSEGRDVINHEDYLVIKRQEEALRALAQQGQEIESKIPRSTSSHI